MEFGYGYKLCFIQKRVFLDSATWIQHETTGTIPSK